MPRKAKELSALDVKRLEHPGRGRNAVFAVGGVSGLMMQVAPTGAKSWILRATVGAKRRDIGLGGYPDVTLAQARERAREARDMIRQGIDPVEQRKAARAALAAQQRRGLTFAKAVEKYCAAKLGELRNEKHKAQWRSTLDAYAVPALGPMLVDEITVSDVQRALEPIWTSKTETASRLRGRIEAVLAWATVAGHRTGDNPARWKGNLDAILPKPGKVAKVAHHPALALADAPDWFADLRGRDGMATRALELMALTAARSGEVRGATWEEFDLTAGLWTIPAERMKAGREHRVPLTAEAVVLLKALPRMAGSSYAFPAARGGMLSDMALSACMRRINEAREGGYLDPRSGRPAVPHGLRSTFRDWTAERGYPRDMAEIALAHTVGSDVERAYRRSDMLDRRRQMMAAWGAFLRGEAGAKVVKMEAAG
ncbi:site-specific integrase [Rhodovulum sp. BSW8]|uniref:Integrase arm-type DNA-binding domain-containing protein n=1 Tax=Rhodovulum visakhapatnamense TaxID=364297 RepID=A0ABS1RB90_9RHOB|nr:site-specific integrase [Rhodovulum sp. BSW8]MBL3569398.1 integrase arm-type DNA-binding domain-containing protein [Rhodovulum visakhapatnamense]MBL3576755.1 integrase arm-type DNA-binding domain-containing protein [Rhodovulum visakhapatnamense]OLS44318.1 integrase [Rhodovulum sulfidophilum]RBO54178.1 site-specific integrase [Rhodovulum sp. BSW8]